MANTKDRSADYGITEAVENEILSQAEAILARRFERGATLLAAEDLFHGTIDGCEVHPRVVATRALELGAAAVILGHQHPSGEPEPSAADRALMARLEQALALLDIRVLDHFVVGGAQTPVSMAARGWV